jgi:hypothetical protein
VLDQLDFLTPAELIILEQHLKLGTVHLKQHLSEDELERLLRFLPLKQVQMAKIGQSDTEISGNLVLVLNTVFTATFGAWMGYSGFWGLSLASFWAFGSIIAIAAIIGALIGYQNVKFTKQQAREAIKNQTFHGLQLEILKKIGQKRREEIDTIGRELNDLFLNLSVGTSFEKEIFALDLVKKSKNEISEWFTRIEAMGKEKLKARLNGLNYEEYADEWMEIQLELRQNLISFFEDKGELGAIHSEARKEKEKTLDPFLKKLVYTSPKKSVESPSWIRSNIQSIALGLSPTLLGGFSSLSVYLGGVPLILKNFGYVKLFIFFTNPQVKTVEFAISLLLTFYFGFSFVYTNWKLFKRQRELDKTNKSIIQKESSLTVLDADMLKLKEVKRSVLELSMFFKIVDIQKSLQNLV